MNKQEILEAALSNLDRATTQDRQGIGRALVALCLSLDEVAKVNNRIELLNKNFYEFNRSSASLQGRLNKWTCAIAVATIVNVLVSIMASIVGLI